MEPQLYEPAARDAAYSGNVAKYLVDLHDQKATFDFCGGMMFQLVLTDKLRSHLEGVAAKGSADGSQPQISDKNTMRMAQMPGYAKTNFADNKMLFHGREVRQVKDAAGGMEFVLQLSHSESDPEGWTGPEVEGYDGWGHDASRVWRNGERLENEGYKTFRSTFGEKAYTLNHRFYLHFDSQNRMWLSAEDGCEGVAAAPKKNLLQQLFK